MPGYWPDGSVWLETDGYAYCDANKVGGNFCPEFDIMEANKYAWASTPHKCDTPSDTRFYSNCDAGGSCHKNTVEDLDYEAYGPGDSYKINTLEPFHAKISFDTDEKNQFASYTTTFTQNGQSLEMISACDYLK